MGGPVILLAGDANHFSGVVREISERSSVEITYAMDGQEAIEKARLRRPGLLCLEQELPAKGGIECINELKAAKDLAGIPVILVAKTSNSEDLQLCRASGCDGLLTSPIDCQRFLEIAHRYIPAIDRRSVRIHCRLTVQFRVDHENQYGTCWDLGMRGMYVAYEGGVVAGVPVEISFVVSDEYPSLVEAWGRVAWVNNGFTRLNPELPDGFGVEFLELADDARKVIRRLIEQC